MKSEIISYTLEKAKAHQKVAIQRALYGYNDLSNNGKYCYKRKGIIDSLSGKKLNRGVFIVPKVHKNKVMTVLKKNKATVKTLSVTI